MRNVLAVACGLVLTAAMALLDGKAHAQITKGALPEEGQSLELPYPVTLVSAMARGHQSAVRQELGSARGTTPARFTLTLVVSDNSFGNGSLTLKNGYQTLDTRKSYRLYLVLDDPAQHPSLYQHLLHCSSLAGIALRGYGHKPPNTGFAENLGQVLIDLQALPGTPMNLSRINSAGELSINLTYLPHDLLRCTTSW